MTAMIALVADPAIQMRAQEEMDSVIGKDRLPTFEDRARLPYMHSIITETLRYLFDAYFCRPCSPIVLSHVLVGVQRLPLASCARRIYNTSFAHVVSAQVCHIGYLRMTNMAATVFLLTVSLSLIRGMK